MSLTLHAAPSSAAPRGEAIMQPSYFTSSLFVDALRADVQELARAYSDDYYRLTSSTSTSAEALRPFVLFKGVWIRQGWQWLHLKVLEPRAQCTQQTETHIMRVIGLFGLYTFYMSQPSSSTPSIHRVTGIPIPIDNLETLLELPASLSNSEEHLRAYVLYVLHTLRPRFLILPSTTLHAQNPRSLPREMVNIEVETSESSNTGKRKTGRPSKAEKAQRVRAAVSGLDRWLDKSSYPAADMPAAADPAGAAGRVNEEVDSGPSTTHIMLSQRPVTSLNAYRAKKAEVLSALALEGSDALDRAAGRVLTRLKEIDAAAAGRGLEVGSEGGELSGIERVERAVAERRVLAVVKSRIIDSVFNKRNAASNGPGESYISHLKIWEIESGIDKPRYIILAGASSGSPLIHKSRVNPNGTFSVGKTWKLADLRGVEVPSPLEIHISFARTYVWQTESLRDQDRFLSTVVSLFKEYVGPISSLRISGFTPSTSARPPARDDLNELRSVKSNATIKDSRSNSRMNGFERTASPAPRSRSRAATGNGRPVSPAGSSRSTRIPSPLRAGTRPSSPRPSSPAISTTGVFSPQRSRRPSAATSASTRSFDSPPASQLPSIVVPRISPSPVPIPASRMKDSSPLRSKPIQAQVQSQDILSTSRSSLDVPSPPSSIPSSSAGVSTMSVTMSNSGASGPGSSSESPVSVYPSSDFAPPTNGSNSRMRRDSAAQRAPSPALSTVSYRSQRSRTAAPSPEPPLPTPTPMRITKLGVPPPLGSAHSSRRDPNARISFFDHANKALLDRLLFSSDVSTRGADKTEGTGEHEVDEGDEGVEGEWEEEGDSAVATLANIEEMLEGYEWIGDGISSRVRKGPAEHIESRLLDELILFERANIHSLLESDDDRMAKVLKGLDEAIAELDGMDKTVSSYKIHLNAVSDDIVYIQSQNRGLQVQTQNQQLLLNELEKLLVCRFSLVKKFRTSLMNVPSLFYRVANGSHEGIAKLEMAAIELYKALLAGRDNDMAATMERLEEYRTHNSQFCKRILDFMTIMFTAQGNMLLGETSGLGPSSEKGRLVIFNHQQIESYLERYCGLMLYMKEMDENKYSKTCAAYFSAASDLHSQQIKAFLTSYSKFIRQASEEEIEQAFASSVTKEGLVSGGLRRAGTVVRSPLELKKEKGKRSGGELKSFEVLDIVLEQIAPQVQRERAFIADFLLIDDAAITFADYVALDHYFRRQAAQYAGLSNTTMKLVRGAMDLIFGFLPTELKAFIDAALAKDNMQIVGVIASIERAIVDAEAHGNPFFAIALDKQHQRLKAIFDRHVDEQIKGVEQTQLDAKKRRGVAHFIRYFPVYVSRIESQLVGADDLEIKGNIDIAYDRIVQSMFDCLKQMAKMDGEQGEDKGQLNYHVILIENMHHFIAEISQMNISAVNSFKKRAEVIYDESLAAYVKIVMRRSFSKIIDYFDGVERMLKTTAPTEVSKNSSYNRSALKRVVKEFNSKDVRKNIDALFKRVEKHFTDSDAPEAASGLAAGTVMVGVWKACEDELLRMTDFYTKQISHCYKGSGVALEYTRVDVEAAFKRHRVGA
ncbi:hypothetical protein EW145_g1521 [Phellinidium pouzarii]|uniref:Exocyst complex component Sec3 PIP2-binding N-terminal domain-containing protein n=1 Tax=Phellinidium pouzarii TaxID=167371 RepID=A0A4S4LG42_9AGAM|nr:hypothetical protein EW145_g1521 [Phellinidium pouzarii]